MSKPVICIECGDEALLASGKDIYPHRKDLYHKSFYRCECGAYCGCHPGTTDPLGYPCAAETRKARSDAHAIFDPMWKRKIQRDGCKKNVARNAGYEWLAREMGMTRDQCHIGMMTADQARRVVEICEGRKK